jgi:uncharacterized protein
MSTSDQGRVAASPTPPGPTPRAERIEGLDLLRGFAVLGILVMNIQSFAMVDPTYFNPTVSGDFTGVNFAIWFVSHVVAEMKFITIFSMLFGAGIVLLCTRAERSGQPPASVLRRRTVWLLVFGLAHAYLFWTGDILVWYAFSATLAYLFWRLRPGWLAFWGVFFLAAGTGLYLFFQWSLPYWPPEGVANVRLWWDPPPEILAARLEAYRGGWLEQMRERIPGALALQTFVYLIFGLWRTLGPMLLGMAFLKWGIVSGQRSTRFYTTMAVVGLACGLPLVGYGLFWNFSHQWSWDSSMYAGSLFNYWGSLFIASAYIALVMLAWHGGWLKGVQRLLAPVGRMAFTSYILQTIVCTTIFYGHGFGLYGSTPRWGQALVVAGVWGVVIVFAHWWLARYRFGPLEWLWRSLTYRARQPMRLETA